MLVRAGIPERNQGKTTELLTLNYQELSYNIYLAKIRILFT